MWEVGFLWILRIEQVYSLEIERGPSQFQCIEFILNDVKKVYHIASNAAEWCEK